MRITGRKIIAIMTALVLMTGLFPVMAEATDEQTAETTAILDVEKVISAEEGVTVPEKKFTFTMAASSPENAPMPEDTSASIIGEGKVSEGNDPFGEITFTEPGDYLYTISEVNEADDGWTYNVNGNVTAAVTVAKDTDSGELSASVEYSKGTDAAEITNKYLAKDSTTMEATTQSYVVNKVDAGSGEDVDGAVIALYEKDDAGNLTPIERWVSVSGETHDFGDKLEAGHDYVLRETTAPKGYGKVMTDITISISEDGALTSSLQPSTQEDGTVVYLIEDSAIRFNVNKTDIADDEELEGAVLTVIEIDETGAENEIGSWTSVMGETFDFGDMLEAGKAYVLREETAPERYEKLATDISFTVNEDGSITTGMSTTTDSEGNVVYLVEDSKLKVKVSKTDIADGKELDGATIQIIDSEGNIFDQWVSTTMPHEIEGLKAGETYTLKETIAPEGYAIATDTTFSIDEEGNITSSGTVSEEGIILIEDAKISVRVSKVDVADGKEIEGATIQLLDAGGTQVFAWRSSDKEPQLIENLQTGVEYTLKEIVAPDGYTIASETTFSVDAQGKITSSGTVTTDGVILIEDGRTKVKVSKVDVADGKELTGATIQIIDAEGTLVDEWPSSEAAYEIEGLKTGVEYTLKETVAPEGYTITTDTTFTIDEAGKVTTTGSLSEDGVLLVEDAKTKIKVSKVDIADGKALAGATLQILDAEGNVVDEWTSSEAAYEPKDLKTGVEYTLKETVAPEGYTITTDTSFTIDEAGKVTFTGTITTDEDGNTVLLVEDAKTKVIISKVDKNNKAVAGAKLQIVDKNAKVADEWTTGNDVHTIEGLDPGEYTLKETAAPSGYNKAASIAFTLGEDGSVKVNGKVVEKITMIDEKITIINKKGTTTVGKVNTGDTSNMLPYVLMMLIAAGVIAGVVIKKKKEYISK